MSMRPSAVTAVTFSFKSTCCGAAISKGEPGEGVGVDVLASFSAVPILICDLVLYDSYSFQQDTHVRSQNR
ncbi:hypothetical protein PI125_g15867 [Phytophthora idaei]|nr:hypothetical protein PI125_g15867 [Phytophthora idaei]KAG3144608.1 hypothetical protein PI126_g14094 [Phytophthora idaei]